MRTTAAGPDALQEALRILAQGGVIIHATETCYGLACDLANIHAIEKLFAIKQRPQNQPVSALFSSIEEAKKYVEWNPEAEELALKHLPGPLTLILPLRAGAPSVFSTPDTGRPAPALGIRISSHLLAMELAKRFGRPLSTTSANLHGKPNPYSPQEILRQLSSGAVQPDLFIDSGELPPTPPSTVLNLSSGGQADMVRQGDLLA